MTLQTQPDLILAQQHGATRVLSFNRPDKRNALESASYRLLAEAVDAAVADQQVANIVLQGVGAFFCSGGDLRSLETRAAISAEERAAGIEGLQGLVRRLRSCPKPLIAAIEGGAAGAGASIALAADLIVAARDSYISMAYVNAGLVPDGGGSAYLAMSLPPQLAAEIALLGERVPIERMAAAGVVNRLTEPGEALAVALALGEQLAAGPRAAQSSILALLDAPERDAFAQHLEREKGRMAVALGGAEAAAGIAAFKERRAPDFPLPIASKSAAAAQDAQPQVLNEQQGRVLYLTISSPGRKNAITGAMYLQVAAALDAAGQDAGVHVVVIQGAEGVFTSGNDVNDFSPRADGQKPPSLVFLESLVAFPKPLVAKVEGLAIGVGCTMLLHCDLVLAANTARFRLPFVNLGLVPEAASSYLLPRMMGHARAAELLMLGEVFPAQVAHEVGLVNTLCEELTLAHRVDEVASALAVQPTQALQRTKALLRDPSTDSLLQRIHAESAVFGACIAGPEFAEAQAAFREKRAPNFN